MMPSIKTRVGVQVCNGNAKSASVSILNHESITPFQKMKCVIAAKKSLLRCGIIATTARALEAGFAENAIPALVLLWTM